MRRYLKHVAAILGGWAQALRTLRANPLPALWQAADARRTAAQPWWRRSPGLMLLAAALSAFAIWAMGMLAYDAIRLAGSSVYTRAYALGNLRSASVLLMGAAGTLCYLWLLARLYRAAVLALGLLERERPKDPGQSVDDLLAVTPLSEQEILVGLTLRGLRLLVVPLAVLSLMVGGLMLLSGEQAASPFYDGGEILKTWGLAAGIGAALLLSVQLMVSGVLAACIVIMLCATLGLCKRAGVLPYMGAAMQVVMQLGLIGMAFVMFDWLQYAPTEPRVPVVVSQYSVLLLLLVALPLCVARRMDWLRLALIFAIPMIFAFVWLRALLAESVGYARVQIAAAAWPSECLAVVSLVHLRDTLSVWDDMSKLPLVFLAQVWHWFIMVVIQLVLLAIMAEFARDAIRRRKWGEA